MTESEKKKYARIVKYARLLQVRISGPGRDWRICGFVKDILILYFESNPPKNTEPYPDPMRTILGYCNIRKYSRLFFIAMFFAWVSGIGAVVSMYPFGHVKEFGMITCFFFSVISLGMLATSIHAFFVEMFIRGQINPADKAATEEFLTILNILGLTTNAPGTAVTLDAGDNRQRANAFLGKVAQVVIWAQGSGDIDLENEWKNHFNTYYKILAPLGLVPYGTQIEEFERPTSTPILFFLPFRS